MKKLVAAASFVALLLCMPAFSEESPPEVNWISGPKTVSVGENLAQLNISDKYVFLNAGDSKKLLKYVKQPTDDQLMGMILPNSQEKDWAVFIDYDPMGYVKDDDAKNLDTDALLKSISEATEEANKERTELGSTPIHVVRWHQKPHYDKKSHHLVWSILLKSDDGSQVVNYNTRILGRGGVTSIVLSTSPERFTAFQSEVEDIIAIPKIIG